MLKKESTKQLEDEVVLQVYTDVDNVENVTKQLNELCLKVSLEPARWQDTEISKTEKHKTKDWNGKK